MFKCTYIMSFRLKIQPLRALSSLSVFCQLQCWNHVEFTEPTLKKMKSERKNHQIKVPIYFHVQVAIGTGTLQPLCRPWGVFVQLVFCHAEVLFIKSISPSFPRWKHDHTLGEVAFGVGDWAWQQVLQQSKLLFFFFFVRECKSYKDILFCARDGEYSA